MKAQVLMILPSRPQNPLPELISRITFWGRWRILRHEVFPLGRIQQSALFQRLGTDCSRCTLLQQTVNAMKYIGTIYSPLLYMAQGVLQTLCRYVSLHTTKTL